MLDEKKLLELKKQVDDAKSTVSELTGQKKALMKQLQEEWECKTVEEAGVKLKEMQTEITALEQTIKTGMEELEKKYLND
jgi:peptidoglycan hydrolase CwlO-like protein